MKLLKDFIHNNKGLVLGGAITGVVTIGLTILIILAAL